MSDPIEEELEYKRELLETHRRRLHKLEKRQAQLGINTPPEIDVEIEDIRLKIAALELEIEKLEKGISIDKTQTGDKVTASLNIIEEIPVAIILSISLDIEDDVRSFLRTEGIKIDVITPYDPRKLKDNKREWQGFARELYHRLSAVLKQSGPRPVHLFISAPATLAFAVGYMLGTQNHARLYFYQWFEDLGRYEEIIAISR